MGSECVCVVEPNKQIQQQQSNDGGNKRGKNNLGIRLLCREEKYIPKTEEVSRQFFSSITPKIHIYDPKLYHSIVHSSGRLFCIQPGEVAYIVTGMF
jgi:hypothetical protein